MRLFKEAKEYEETNKHERLLMFICFLAASLVGYLLTNHVALLGV